MPRLIGIGRERKMELPKGFKKIVSQGLNPEWRTYIVGIDPKDLAMALDLMKEMAEALESEFPNSLALQKFREWK